jgi:hypothetical protein
MQAAAARNPAYLSYALCINLPRRTQSPGRYQPIRSSGHDFQGGASAAKDFLRGRLLMREGKAMTIHPDFGGSIFLSPSIYVQYVAIHQLFVGMAQQP